MERSIKIFNVTYTIRSHAAMRSLQKNIPDDLIVNTVEKVILLSKNTVRINMSGNILMKNIQMNMLLLRFGL